MFQKSRYLLYMCITVFICIIYHDLSSKSELEYRLIGLVQVIEAQSVIGFCICNCILVKSGQVY